MSDDDTYEAQAFCRNCGYEGPVTVGTGTAVHSIACPLCSCRFLSPVAQRDWDQRQKWLPERDD